LSIAPFIARLPQLIPTPSNAGPAAVDAAKILFFATSAISPLVPISTYKMFFLLSNIFICFLLPARFRH
jgi:hypothetical protein